MTITFSFLNGLYNRSFHLMILQYYVVHDSKKKKYTYMLSVWPYLFDLLSPEPQLPNPKFQTLNREP